MDAYITRAELRKPPYLIDEGQADNTYLEVLQDMTKGYVERATGRAFEPIGTDLAPVEEQISGTGKDTIFLPARMITLKKIKIYTGTNEYVEYTPENFTVKAKFISWKIYAESSNPARFRVEVFPEGKYNIGVVGIWGYASCPSAVKYAQAKLIKKVIEDDSFAERFMSQSLGDFSGDVGGGEAIITGDREIDLVLKQYREMLWLRAF